MTVNRHCARRRDVATDRPITLLRSTPTPFRPRALARAMALGLLAALPSCALRAAPLLSSDVIVSVYGSSSPRSFVQEYGRDGTLVQSWPMGTGGNEFARGLAVDGAGNVSVYNGTFFPTLTVLTPSTGDQLARSAAGWNTSNVPQQGQVAVIGEYAYPSDTLANGDPAGMAGIVRFNLNYPYTPEGSRFGSNEATALGKGLNGLLYAVWPNTTPGANKVDVWDPSRLTNLRTVTLPVSVSGIAADATGNLYGTSGATLYKFDPNGNTLASFNTGIAGLGALDISASGELITTNGVGTVVLTDTAFSALNQFSVTYPSGQVYSTFAGFAAAPEPATACGALLPLFSLLALGRRPRADR